MDDTTHLVALQTRLANERQRLVNAKTANEKAVRAVWVAGIEREVADEMQFLGIAHELPDMTDDEILAALKS